MVLLVFRNTTNLRTDLAESGNVSAGLGLILLEHATSLHALKLLAHTGFLDLALLAILGVFKGTTVTKFHQVSRLVDFALEASQGAFNGFAITHNHLDLDGKLCSGGSDHCGDG